MYIVLTSCDSDPDKVRKEEVRSRMVYDNQNKLLAMRKRKVTDLRQNRKVYQPPPLNPGSEVGQAVRKQEMLEVFNRFRSENCDNRGRQMANSLSFDQRQWHKGREVMDVGIKGFKSKLRRNNVHRPTSQIRLNMDLRLVPT